MSRHLDLTGKRFNRLMVIRRVSNNKHKKSMWLCVCDCGNKTTIYGSHIVSSHTKSCGCLSTEKVIERSIRHGHSTRDNASKVYVSWNNMIQRCTNRDHKQWNDYGGRGITVCGRWMKFVNFLEDMGEAPLGYQIDRIDNDKGYYKSNCHWATRIQQCRNKRNNYLITFDGETKCLSEWANELGINAQTLWGRIKQYGWSITKSFTTPVRKRKEFSI